MSDIHGVLQEINSKIDSHEIESGEGRYDVPPERAMLIAKIAEIKGLIGKGKAERALEKYKDVDERSAISMQSQWNRIKNEEVSGVITLEQAETFRMRLTNGLLDQLDSLQS